MPFLEEPPEIDISIPGRPEPVPPPVMSAFPLGAGLRRGSEIFSILTRDDLGVDNRPEYGYDAWKDIEGTEFEQYWYAFVDVRNSRLAAARKRSIMQQIEDRTALEAAGIGGLVAETIGNLTSPLTFVPGGAMIRAARGAEGIFSVSRSALSVGRASAVQIVPQELLLQASQEDRTATEGFINVGAGVVLGMALGGAGAAALNPFFRAQAERAVLKMVQATDIDGSAIKSSIPSPLGGAIPDAPPPRDDFEITGRFARAIDDVTSRLYPVRRLARSASGEVRRFAATLVENVLETAAQARGDVLTPMGSVERQFRYRYDSLVGNAITEVDEIFKKARQSGLALGRREFNEAVGDALRAGDQHATAAVAQAAQHWRKSVMNPIAAELKSLGLARIEGKVLGAISYFPRVYNRHRLRAEEYVFKGAAQPHMERIVKEAHDADVEKTAARVARYNQDAADLELPAEARPAAVSAIDAKIGHLEASEPYLAEAVDVLDNLGKEIREARAAGDPEKAARLRQQAADMRESIDKLASFNAERKELKRRRAQLERVSRKEAQIDKIRQNLVDIEEAMQKGLERFAKQWAKFQREAEGLTPEAVTEKVTALQEQFEKLVHQGDAALEKTMKHIEALDKQVADANAKIEQASKGEAPNLVKIAEMQKQAGELEEAVRPLRRRLLRLAEEQDKRSTQLRLVAGRLDEAELDPEFAREQLELAYQTVLTQASNTALGRGERAAALQERLAKLDPDFLAKEAARKRAQAARAQENFDKRWAEALKTGQKEGVDPFARIAREAINDLFTKIAGLQYVKEHNTPFLHQIERGPLKNRTNPLPDEVMRPWLESHAEDVLRHWSRVSLGEIELAKMDMRMGGPGDPNLDLMFQKIRADYDNISKQIDAATSVEEVRSVLGQKVKGETLEIAKANALTALRKDQKLATDDLTAMRDLIRGTYKIAENSGGWGRLARAANLFNYVRLGGFFGVSSIGDLYRGAMVHGLAKYMSEGVAPLIRGLDAAKLSKKEARLAGLALQTALHHKTISIGELGDPFARYTPAERFLQNAGTYMSRFNLLNLEQDVSEAANALIFQNKILRDDGTDAFFAHLNLNRDMRDRIKAHFEKHGNDTEGVAVANTEKWTRDGELDQIAIDAYRRAIAQAVQETAVMPGLGEKPLFAYGPLGSMILQFRAFNLAAHQRILMRGLQGEAGRLVSGIVGMTSVGVLVSYLKARARGEEGYEKWLEKLNAAGPLWLLAEGLDNSGIFTLAFEVGRAVESTSTAAIGKAWNPMQTILTLGGAPIDSRQRTNVFEGMAGPSIGLGADIPQALGTAGRYVYGENITKSEARRAFGTLPGSSLPIFKDITQILNDDHPWM